MSTRSRGISIGPPRFNIAVRALVWLSRSEGKLSSASIACQVNSHATFLRRVLVLLVNAGIVEAREGREGGYILRRPSSQITLADVYMAVKSECSEIEETGNCGEAGKQLDMAIEKIMNEAEQKTLDFLRQYTISDLIANMDLFTDI
ncbi:Rrf2 family transcriptional regulator [Bacillus sp. 03113]|uniref:RrF2 family transcriptional regulator n=1 Tax=Bacillus sp. 03113 TaxID=2578211 RepID=UPI001141A852|nr:Rrf2 family transcriptional regulator [Bacillus sp. 03113]